MLATEKTLTFSEAAAILPMFNGKRPHTSTVWRWARKGCRGVRLESLRLGGRFVTSVQALERFGQALAEADNLPQASVRKPATPTAKQRERSIQHAEDVLHKAGISA